MTKSLLRALPILVLALPAFSGTPGAGPTSAALRQLESLALPDRERPVFQPPQP